jgi:hypothetical protein
VHRRTVYAEAGLAHRGTGAVDIAVSVEAGG